MEVGSRQIWKKLQAALVDILSEITLIWGLCEPNIPFFLCRMEKEDLKTKNWSWIKEILGRRIEKGGFRIKNWGWSAMDWGLVFKIWGFDNATPTFETHVSDHLLSRITLFWGHWKALNFPLEEDPQLFPGLALESTGIFSGGKIGPTSPHF